MLTLLLIRDETTASLGKTEHTFMVYVSGKQSAWTFVASLNSFHVSVDRKKRS